MEFKKKHDSRAKRRARAKEDAENFIQEKRFKEISKVHTSRKKTSNTSIEAYADNTPKKIFKGATHERVTKNGFTTYRKLKETKSNEEYKKGSVRAILTPMGNKKK